MLARLWGNTKSLVALVGLCAVLGTGAGCSDDDRRPGGGGSAGRAGSDDGGAAGFTPIGCIDGETEECKETVGTATGVTSCYYGRKTCVDGEWGPCLPNGAAGAGTAGAAGEAGAGEAGTAGGD